MASDSLTHSRLDQIRGRCDGLLDESTSLVEYARALVNAVVEIEELAAASVIEFRTADDYRLVADCRLASLSADGFFSVDPDHVSLLLNVIRQQKPDVVSDRAVPEAGLKRHSIVIAPVTGKQVPFRLVELFTFQVPDAERAAHLKEVAETLAKYLARFEQDHTAKQASPTGDDFWKQFDLFVLKLQKSLDTKQTVAVAVNDGRALIGCDRVSIALRYGGRARVVGVSGQESVHQRANLIKSMTRIARVVMKLGAPVTYRGVIEGLPPELEGPLADYLTESRTRMVMMIPLREPVPFDPDEDQKEKPRPKPSKRKVIGCLIVEQATETRPKPAVVDRTELVTDHIESALHNSERYESIFLLPLWRGLGRTVRWFRGRRLWITAAVLAGLTAVSLILALVPWDYRVEADGQAMPRVQHQVFAPLDGEVREIAVESGQRVREGDILVILENDDLDAERIALASELQEKQKLVASLERHQAEVERQRDTEAITRARAELTKAEIEMESARARLEKIDSRLQKLIVRAPSDGVVATFQVQQLLQNRPVSRGDQLLEVMEPDGPWRLELEIPEYRMGHIAKALAKSDNGRLPVEYVLATAVETSYFGELTEIATRADQSAEEGTIVEGYADIDHGELPQANIGARVTAKIDCGEKSLFYVLFGDVVEFFQRFFWI